MVHGRRSYLLTSLISNGTGVAMGAGDTGQLSTGELIGGALLCVELVSEGGVVDDVAVVSCG